jgi:hypothetical protein
MQLKTILCVVTALCLQVTCHPTLENRSLPKVPNLSDTTDNRKYFRLCFSKMYVNKHSSV